MIHHDPSTPQKYIFEISIENKINMLKNLIIFGYLQMRVC